MKVAKKKLPNKKLKTQWRFSRLKTNTNTKPPWINEREKQQVVNQHFSFYKNHQAGRHWHPQKPPQKVIDFIV
jgi:hypothetical protein